MASGASLGTGIGRSLRAAIALGFVLAFAAGVATGRFLRPAARTPADQTYLQDLANRYGLDDGQLARIRAHLQQEELRIHGILASVEAGVKDDVRAVRADVQQKIRAELTEEQRQAFDRDAAGT